MRSTLSGAWAWETKARAEALSRLERADSMRYDPREGYGA